MLTKEESLWVAERAYIPEHLTNYLVPFSQMEPSLEDDFLVYTKGKRVSLIGYPLEGSFSHDRLQVVAEKLIQKYNPEHMAIMAPELISLAGYELERQEEDMISRLPLDYININTKTRNMLLRAGKELDISVGKTYTMEHQRILQLFIKEKEFNQEISDFMHMLPDYLTYSPTALLIEARRKDNKALVAYNVLEYSPGDYCFYLFNITDIKRNIPGSCDLLMEEMLLQAQGAGKKYINMGLDINMGIGWFKKKWGAKPFLQYRFMAFKRKTPLSAFFCFLRK